MNYENLTFGTDGNVATVTLNRPEKRNALSFALMTELTDCFDEISRSPEIRVVILAAAGSVYSSGHDLSELVDRDVNDYRRIFATSTRLMEKIQSVPQPVIARVQGLATAAGCQLVATCDLAIAADTASFGTPGVKIGLFCTTPMVAITRAIGRKRAMEMLLTGRVIDARTAAEWGLVNRAVPLAQLPDETNLLATQIAEASRLIVGLGKEAFYAQIDLSQGQAYNYAKEVMTMNSLTEDAREGIRAFLQKRSPTWTGR